AQSGTLFFDDFEDGNASDWTVVKGTWNVVGGNLNGTTAKKAEIHAPFTGCQICTVETTMQVTTAGGRASLLGWFNNSKDGVELIMMQDKGKWLLKESVNGTVAKKTVLKPLALNTDFHVKLSFDGTNFI